MAKIDRLERLDAQRVELEVEYLVVLIAALRETAAGKWGLFGHNPEGTHQWNRPPAVVGELAELAASIDSMRDKLMLDQFALHQDFLAARGRVAAHAVGEPKQAKAWLDKLAAE